MRTLTVLKNALFAKSGEEFAEVKLPHTWNTLDGQDGGSDYWRGTAVYKINLPEPTPGKRQYIQFEGANHIATVFCNGKELGTHKGGFSTFRYALTEERNKGVVSDAPKTAEEKEAEKIKLMVIGFPMIAALCSFCCFTFIWNINADVRAKMAQWKAAKAAK